MTHSPLISRKTIVFLLFYLLYLKVSAQKITLNPSMVFNESLAGNATLLTDEQGLAGDPASNKGGAVTTQWSPGYSPIYFPANAIIDLGRTFKISHIYLYDGTGTGTATISAGLPFKWDPLFTDSLKKYKNWNPHIVNVETRYIRVTLTNSIGPNEIVIYGSPTGTITSPPPLPEPAVHKFPTMDQLIGINAFVDDPIPVQKVADYVREYHNWRWNEDAEGKNKFNPSYPGWNFDLFYKKIKDSGIVIAPVLQSSVKWLTPEYSDKPIIAGTNPESPFSYAKHADFMFQYAARYGNSPVADSKLKLASGQPRVSGLKLIQYYEDWNEQDRTWDGRSGYFNPYEYAAMASADYDGHKGAMGTTFGIKNADPSAKMVMGGIATLSLDYLKLMKFWSDHNRGGSFPADVINVHHYCNNAGSQVGGRIGISPEADSLRKKIENLVTFKNTYLPGKEVWITEFGFDTHPSSSQRAPSISNFSQEEVQGQWIVRSYLEIAAGGADKAFMYMLRDVDTLSSTKYNTCGLTTMKGSWRPKISWYYLYTLKNQLKGFRFNKEVKTTNSNVKVYEFANSLVNKFIYVVWCPTSNGTVVNNYLLTLPQGTTQATMVTLEKGDIDGEKRSISVNSGKATLNVSERPIFILAGDQIITGNQSAKEELHLKVYPTITNNSIKIEIPSNKGLSEKITLVNSLGLIVQEIILNGSDKEISMDLSGLNEGIYYLKYEYLGNTISEKILKY